MIRNDAFLCEHCQRNIPLIQSIGTHNRNHCPYCLWSKHVDDRVPGDRKAVCQHMMAPIALTYKRSAPDKYGKTTFGELMIVHECDGCKKISINRIAEDDDEHVLYALFQVSCILPNNVLDTLVQHGIYITGPDDKKEVYQQLFGKSDAGRIH